MFDGSFQLLTISDHYLVSRDFFSSSSNVVGKDGPALSAVVESWEELPDIWLRAANNAFVGLAFNFSLHVIERRINKKLTCQKGSIVHVI